MRIALVAHAIHDGGGMERCMANLARWLKRRGESVHLYTAEAYCPLSDEGFPWFRIPTVARPLSLRLWLFYQRSKKIIHWDNYDIIHANGGIIPQQTVTTIHFCQAAWRQILNDPKTRESYRNSNVWRLWNRQISSLYAERLERQAVHGSQRVVCVSKQVAHEVEKFYKPKNPPSIVYNGVSIVDFTPSTDLETRNQHRTALGANPQDTVLLFVGGEFERKGLPTVLNALHRLNNPEIKLWVVGEDPVKEQFKQMARDFGITNQVTFVGFSNQIAKLMQSSDMFVFPSQYDPFGLVITEAMATGIPVITSRNAGAGELIEDGLNGFLLNLPDDSEQLSQLILKLREHPEIVKSVGLAARNTALQHTWEHMSEGFYQHYCQILGQVAAHAS